MNAPFNLRLPRTLSPVVYDSPHSGRYYPPSWQTLATGNQLRQGEDGYVDDLIGGALELGVAVLTATYPRCYIDVNREETDIDAGLLSDEWPEPHAPSEKTERGLGLIRRLVIPGVEVNAGPISSAQVMERIRDIYRPYHHTLRNLLDEVRAECGLVWHVSWHSMKSKGNAITPDGPAAIRPDFVVSDADGTTCSPDLTGTIVATLRDRGFSVQVNDPYRGGTIIRKFGKPEREYHSVQVEINRALYLNEETVTLTPDAAHLKAEIEYLTTVLLERAG